MHTKNLREYFNQMLDKWIDGEISSTEFLAAIATKMILCNTETNRCERWLPFV